MNLQLKASISPVEQGNSLKAIATLTINDAICIKSITIREGVNGLFVSMPRLKKTNGKYEDLVFPITAEYRNQINDFMIKEYQKKVGEENG